MSDTPLTDAVPTLVAAVYEAAAPAERKHLLEQLLQPLGLLSLAAVANGMFARFGLRGGWTPLQLQADEVQSVQSQDVAVLADYLQQLGIHTFDGVCQVLSNSPALMGTAAATVLLALLSTQIQRRKSARVDDFDPP